MCDDEDRDPAARADLLERRKRRVVLLIGVAFAVGWRFDLGEDVDDHESGVGVVI